MEALIGDYVCCEKYGCYSADIRKMYKKALETSHGIDPLMEALTSECFGRYCAQKGQFGRAGREFANALKLYETWGAFNKVVLGLWEYERYLVAHFEYLAGQDANIGVLGSQSFVCMFISIYVYMCVILAAAKPR